MNLKFKKVLATLLITLFSVNMSSAAGLSFNGVKQIFKADLQSQRVPAGKHIKVRFLDDLNTVRSLSGDQFSAAIAEDIIVDKKILLPSGTIMRGVVENITKSSRPKSPAIIYLAFDHIVTPVGKQVPITLKLANLTNLTTEGGISAGGSYRETWEKSVRESHEFVKKSVQFGIDSGDVSKYLLTPVTAIGGSCCSFLMLLGKSVYNLFLKGDEVIIAQGQIVSSVLTEPLDIPTN